MFPATPLHGRPHPRPAWQQLAAPKGFAREAPASPQSHGSWLGARAVQVKAPGPHRPVCQSPGGSGRMLDRGLFPKASVILQEKARF